MTKRKFATLNISIGGVDPQIADELKKCIVNAAENFLRDGKDIFPPLPLIAFLLKDGAEAIAKLGDKKFGKKPALRKKESKSVNELFVALNKIYGDEIEGYRDSGKIPILMKEIAGALGISQSTITRISKHPAITSVFKIERGKWYSYLSLHKPAAKI